MRTVGYLLGCIVMGVLFDRPTLNRDLLMFLAISGFGLATAIVPWCEIYEVMVIMHVVKGTFSGAAGACKYIRR
jgi:MFS family permease